MTRRIQLQSCGDNVELVAESASTRQGAFTLGGGERTSNAGVHQPGRVGGLDAAEELLPLRRAGRFIPQAAPDFRPNLAADGIFTPFVHRLGIDLLHSREKEPAIAPTLCRHGGPREGIVVITERTIVIRGEGRVLFGDGIAEQHGSLLEGAGVGSPLLNGAGQVTGLWQPDGREAVREPVPLALRPSIAEFKPTTPRHFSVTYRWNVEKPASGDWRFFVHFIDSADKIRFQHDQIPNPALAQWPVGEVKQGPFDLAVPAGLKGDFSIYMGLFSSPGLERAALVDASSGQRRVLVGKLKVDGDRVEFEPAQAAPAQSTGDPGLFVRADNGWAAGLHPMDRFLKNTHEILSPLNEITSQVPVTQHQFLTADRKVQRTVSGEGANAVEAVVNASAAEYRHASKFDGDVVLPPYGFLVESRTFVAFHALSWGGLRYAAPTLFTLRSTDGTPLRQSKQIRVFHAFGDARLKLGDATPIRTVAKESVLANQ